MTIDVIIGNPPYQEDTGGGKSGAKALWQLFIDKAIKIRADKISLITPSRWFTSGHGLTEDWIKNWYNNKYIEKIVHYYFCEDVFPGTSIAGGVSYFLHNSKRVSIKGENNIIEFKNIVLEEYNLRILNEHKIFIQSIYGNSIYNKANNYIKSNNLKRMSEIVKGMTYYGLDTTYRGKEGEFKVISPVKGLRVKREDLKELPIGYRIAISRVDNDRGGCNGRRLAKKLLSTVQLVKPDEVIIAYNTIGSFETEQEVVNCINFLKTKTIRKLIDFNLSGIGITSKSFECVPLLNFTIAYTEEEIQKLFNLNTEEINYINKTIK